MSIAICVDELRDQLLEFDSDEMAVMDDYGLKIVDSDGNYVDYVNFIERIDG